MRWMDGTDIIVLSSGGLTRRGAGPLALFTIRALRQLLERLLASAALLDVD